MSQIEDLKELVSQIVNITKQIESEGFNNILQKGPVIVHQRFCNKLVDVMKNNPNKAAIDVPEAMKVIHAIDILEECYPELKAVKPQSE